MAVPESYESPPEMVAWARWRPMATRLLAIAAQQIDRLTPGRPR